jgi:adenosylcobinamide kinase / adenosylcobinamide-phosphate guanylyltransferase
MITLVIGGARSGKSSFALRTAADMKGRKACIVTAQPLDAEMQRRIEKHRFERSAAWDTFEEPIAIARLLDEVGADYDVILVDCLTLWLSNLMMNSADVEAEIKSLVSAAVSCRAELFMVSNEVGMGIVPDNEMARLFRDYAGIMNRMTAEKADNVYLLTAGIPVKIK